MDKNLDYVLKTKEQLSKTPWVSEEKEILKEAVAELKKRELSKYQIRELFRVEFLKQDNSHMISNNTRYLELLDEILNG